MSSIKKFLAATVLFTGLLLLAAPKAAVGDQPEIEVTVVSGHTRAAGVSVYLYNAGQSGCDCHNGGCVIAAVATAITDVSGNASFTNLVDDAEYRVCVGVGCQTRRQCTNPDTDCSFSKTIAGGGCRTVFAKTGQNAAFFHLNP